MSFANRAYRWLNGQPGMKMPLKEPPLRVAGQSLGEDCDQIVLEIALMALFPIAILIVISWQCAKMAWGQLGAPFWVALVNVGLLFIFLLVATSPFLAWWWWAFFKRVKKLRCYRLGLIAERYIGQQLDRCRYLDYSVFHDIVITKGKKTFNIDHVLIGPGGVYVIETKAKSIPIEQKGRPTLKFDGVRLTFPSGFDSAEEVNQAEANANYIKKLLLDLLKKKPGPTSCEFTWENPPKVIPILVYPGWYIDFKESQGKTELKVLEDNGMVEYIKNAKQYERLTKPQYIELRELLGAHLRDEHRGMLITE